MRQGQRRSEELAGKVEALAWGGEEVGRWGSGACLNFWWNFC